MVDVPDTAARQLPRSRDEVIRLAIGRYLEDLDDLAVAIDRLRDSSELVLGWDQVRSTVINVKVGHADSS